MLIETAIVSTDGVPHRASHFIVVLGTVKNCTRGLPVPRQFEVSGGQPMVNRGFPRA